MNPRPFISHLLFVGGRQARIRGDVVHIQLHLFDLRLHILFGRDVSRGGLVAFRKLNIVQVDRVPGDDIEDYFLQGLARFGRINGFIHIRIWSRWRA